MPPWVCQCTQVTVRREKVSLEDIRLSAEDLCKKYNQSLLVSIQVALEHNEDILKKISDGTIKIKGKREMAEARS